MRSVSEMDSLFINEFSEAQISVYLKSFFSVILYLVTFNLKKECNFLNTCLRVGRTLNQENAD